MSAPDRPTELYQGADGYLYTTGTDAPVCCSWFAACRHRAEAVEPVPGLGGVPICGPCQRTIARP